MKRVKQTKTDDKSWLKASSEYFSELLQMWKPLEPMTVSQWADSERRLSQEGTALWGRWNTSNVEYQREVMDTIGDMNIERVVLMWSAQSGKTEILNNTIGYFVSREPCPIMVVQPTISMAQSYSKQRIAPMIRDTPDLEKRFAKLATRRSNNTMLEKLFPGGMLVMSGANSPASLASRPIRVLMFDEVDRAPDVIKKEGDPVDLAEQRTTSFYNRKIILTSTPTTKSDSRIYAAYNESSQGVWEKQCPACGEWQQLLWKDIKYTKSEDNTCDGEPLAACNRCGVLSTEYEWKRTAGRWFHHKPESPVKGFHLNKLVSPFVSWIEIVNEWLEAQGDNARLQVFVNTSLAEVWDIPGEVIEENTIMRRREPYAAQVPKKCLLLTMGVDVQDDRLEYEIVGWGRGKESWGIEYGRLYGNPQYTYDRDVNGEFIESVWTKLDMVRRREFATEQGTKMTISRTCVDSGYATGAVYAYCKMREPNVFAIKGIGGMGKGIVYQNTRTKKENATLFIIGVDTAKDTLFARFKIEYASAGYCHFPLNEDAGYDEEYFAGLTNEKRVRHKDKKGFWTYAYEKIEASKPNEPLDCRVYNIAALEILNPQFDVLAKRAKDGDTQADNIVDRLRNPYTNKPVIPERAVRNARVSTSSGASNFQV